MRLAAQERLGQALYHAEVNYQQVSDQLQGQAAPGQLQAMQAKIDEAVGAFIFSFSPPPSRMSAWH